MVKKIALSTLALATLSTCGFFLPDDFPSYLPFVEGVFDLRAEMDSLGFEDFHSYDVKTGWLPLPRYGNDWVFIHMDVPTTGGKHIGVLALNRTDLSKKGWKENGGSITQSPFLYETVNGWATGNTEWKVNSGSLEITQIAAYPPPTPPHFDNTCFNAPLGAANYVYTASYNSGPPASIKYDPANSYPDSWTNPTTNINITTTLALTQGTGTIKQAANLSDGRVAILVVGYGGDTIAEGQMGFYPSASSVYDTIAGGLAPFSKTVTGFPVYKTEEPGGAWITTDGPVIWNTNLNQLERYNPEDGSKMMDSLSVPSQFVPLGFSVEGKQWLGYDKESGMLYRLRAWW